jgi:hypothetical protein
MGEVLASLSRTAEWMGDRVRAARYAEEALEIRCSPGDDRLMGNAAGCAERGRSGTSPGKALLTQALAHQRRAGDVLGYCWWLINLAAFQLAGRSSQAAPELLPT